MFGEGQAQSEVFLADFRLLGDNHGALDSVFKLANIAGPLVTVQEGHGGWRDTIDALVHGSGELADKVFNQNRDIALAIAQRRQLDLKNIQAVEEVGAKAAFLDELFEFLVGGGDAAEVNLDGMRAADALDFAFLEDTQQIGLGFQADVADFIEKDGAALGNFKTALLAVLRAGKRAFFMAEKLAFEERFRQRAAMDHHQRIVVAGAGRMDRAGAEFLAGAAFAGNQNGGVGGANRLDSFKDANHRGALSHNFLRTNHGSNGFAQAHVLLFGTFVREGVVDAVSDVVRVKGLGDIIVGAILEGCDGRLHTGVAGDDDHEHFGVDLAHAALELDAIGAGHLDVDEGQVKALRGHLGERILGTLGHGDAVAFLAKPLIERVADNQFVIDNQQIRLLGHDSCSSPRDNRGAIVQHDIGMHRQGDREGSATAGL